MSTEPQPSGGIDAETKAGRLRTYLERRTEDGEMYFKGKFIADEVGLSPKEIGALMHQLQDSADAIEIEPWSYTGATTWRVSSA